MIEPKRFDPETATHEEFVAINNYWNLLGAESNPDDPPRSLESTIKGLKTWKTFKKVDIHVWNVWDEGEIIANFGGNVGFHDENRHLLGCGIAVLPEHRRKGLATQLLKKLVEIAEANERTLIITGTDSTVPAGHAFAEKLGMDKGLESHTNQLVLAEVDKSLLETWINEAKTKATDFELGLWLNVYPEEEIEDIAKFYGVMNDAPRGDLQVEDSTVKPEQLREGEFSMKARGVERWVLYARHKSGELAGFTQMFYDPENPENLDQGNTGVVPKYRGQGLGKWLKAAMLQKVFAERPTAKHIRTGNADSNEHMLAINHALGFKPYIAHTVWQIEVAKIKAYLQNKVV
jgi:mycothiol synthase